MPVPTEAKVSQFDHMTRKEVALRLIQAEKTLKYFKEKRDNVFRELRTPLSSERMSQVLLGLGDLLYTVKRYEKMVISLRSESKSLE